MRLGSGGGSKIEVRFSDPDPNILRQLSFIGVGDDAVVITNDEVGFYKLRLLTLQNDLEKYKTKKINSKKWNEGELADNFTKPKYFQYRLIETCCKHALSYYNSVGQAKPDFIFQIKHTVNLMVQFCERFKALTSAFEGNELVDIIERNLADIDSSFEEYKNDLDPNFMAELSKSLQTDRTNFQMAKASASFFQTLIGRQEKCINQFNDLIESLGKPLAPSIKNN